MTGVEIGAAAKALSGVAAKPALRKLGRTEGVVALLQKLRLKPEVPPSDFDSVYVYALVEYCYGKPEPVIKLFQNEYVRAAFRRSFDNGDPVHLEREVRHIIVWNDETGALGRIDYNLALEVTGFSAVFDRLVGLTRSVAEVRTENKIDGLQAALDSLITRIDQAGSREEIVRNELGLPVSPLRRLERDVREWFDAVEYQIERELPGYDDCFVWLVRVPARRGYDLTVVYGADGELTVPQIEQLRGLVGEHRAREGWAIVPSRISPAARKADEDHEEIYCYTFDELLDDQADFGPYLDWLNREVESRGITSRYVTLSCRKDEQGGLVQAVSEYSWRRGGLDDYVGRWLEDDTKEHLSILGEFGTGKTWFTLHYAWTIAQQWRAAKAAGRRRPRLPLVVPLRDYAKAVSIESLFSEFFFRKHGILRDYRVFEVLNRFGKLLLIFDGFDEMAAKVDRQAMINNFWELARTVVPGSKVLLTCRTEHFPDAKHGRDLLGAKLQASTAALTGEAPQFEVVEVTPLDHAQIGAVLARITDRATADRILDNAGLLDLVARPVMCDLVLSAMPEIEAGAKIDMSRIYLYAVRRKIDEDITAERTFTSRADKVYFLCQLSSYMEQNSVLSLNYRDFPERIRECFGPAVAEQRDLDHWQYDMTGQTMLVRNAAGDYAPMHRSLLEFFVAYHTVAILGAMNADFLGLAGLDYDPAGEELAWPELPRFRPAKRAGVRSWKREGFDSLVDAIGDAALPESILRLAAPMLRDGAAGDLVEVAAGTAGRSRAECGRLAANCVALAVLADRSSMANKDLDGAKLRSATLHVASGGADLTGARLRGADLRRANLGLARLTGADLSDSLLDGAVDLGVGLEGVGRFVPTGPKMFMVTIGGDIWEHAIDTDFQRVHSVGQQVESIFQVSDRKLAIKSSDGPWSLLDLTTGSVREIDLPGRPSGSLDDDILVLDVTSPDSRDRLTLQTFSMAQRRALDEITVDGYSIGIVSSSGRPICVRYDDETITTLPLFADESRRLRRGREFTIGIQPDSNWNYLTGDDTACVLFWSRNTDLTNGKLVVHSLDGELLHEMALPPVVANGFTSESMLRSGSYGVLREAGIALFGLTDRACVVDLVTGTVLFEIPSEKPAVMSTLGRVLYLGDLYGNIERWGLDGKKISSINISGHLRGTNFTGASGLNDTLRGKLRSAGAIVDAVDAE